MLTRERPLPEYIALRSQLHENRRMIGRVRLVTNRNGSHRRFGSDVSQITVMHYESAPSLRQEAMGGEADGGFAP